MKQLISRITVLTVLVLSSFCISAVAELRVIEEKGKFGYADESGTTVIKPQYTAAYPFADGLALVRKNGKYGYIRRDGTYQIKPEYDYIGRYNDQGYCWVAKGGNLNTAMKGLYKDEVLIIKPKYSQLGFYFKTDSADYTDGKIILPEKANEIRANLSKLSLPEIPYIWAMKSSAQRTVLDMNGTELMKPVNYALGAPKDGMVIMEAANNKYYFYNYTDVSTGKSKKLFKNDISKERKANAKVNACRPFNKGRAAIQDGTNFYIIDTSGKQVSDTYSLIKPIGNVGYITVKSKLCGLLDDAGNETVAPKFKEIWYNDNAENIMGAQDVQTGLCGFIDAKGATVVPFQYKQANNFNFGRGLVKTSDGWGMIDRNNKQVIACRYSDITVPRFKESDIIWVKHKTDGKWHSRSISTDSEPFAASFDKAGAFNKDNRAYVAINTTTDGKKTESFGLVNHLGETLIPTAFGTTDLVDKAFAYITSQGKSVMSEIDAYRFALYNHPEIHKFKLTDDISESFWDY